MNAQILQYSSLHFRDKGVHSVLGSVDVRHLLMLQHHRPPQHAHRHDEQLLSEYLRQ